MLCAHSPKIFANGQRGKLALDRLVITLIGRAKKEGLHVLRCPAFTENIGGEHKKGLHCS